METTMLNIDPQGYLVFFILFSSVTVILAFIIYALLCSSKFRRPQFREGRKLSKVSALLIVAPLVGVLLWHIYSESWGYFFTLESNARTIDIGYYYPARKITLNKADIVAIHLTSHIRKGGMQYRLVIQSGDETKYSSQLIGQQHIKRIIANLETELNVKVKT